MFAVVSVPRQVAEQLEPSDDSSGQSIIDYSEKRSLPISIPDYQSLERFGDKYVVSIALECTLRYLSNSSSRDSLIVGELFEMR